MDVDLTIEVVKFDKYQVRIEEQLKAINSRGSRLDGGGLMISVRQSNHGSPNKILGWRIGEERLAINSRVSQPTLWREGDA